MNIPLNKHVTLRIRAKVAGLIIYHFAQCIRMGDSLDYVEERWDIILSFYLCGYTPSRQDTETIVASFVSMLRRWVECNVSEINDFIAAQLGEGVDSDAIGIELSQRHFRLVNRHEVVFECVFMKDRSLDHEAQTFTTVTPLRAINTLPQLLHYLDLLESENPPPLPSCFLTFNRILGAIEQRLTCQASYHNDTGWLHLEERRVTVPHPICEMEAFRSVPRFIEDIWVDGGATSPLAKLFLQVRPVRGLPSGSTVFQEFLSGLANVIQKTSFIRDCFKSGLAMRSRFYPTPLSKALDPDFCSTSDKDGEQCSSSFYKPQGDNNG